MRRIAAFVVSALCAMLIAMTAYGQPATVGGPDPKPAPDSMPGMKAGAMPMMEMCRGMMAAMSGTDGASGAPAMDPRARAEMLQMHGEMMKAMGDIMMKHAQGSPK